MSLEVNVLKNYPINFQLSLPALPVTTDNNLVASRELSLNIFGTILPDISLDLQEMRWQGAKAMYDSGGISYGQWTFNFIVDSALSNWKILFKWLTYINNNREIHGRIRSEYKVDASLVMNDNFNNEVVRVVFLNAWISQLGMLTLSSRDSEQFLECEATLIYDRYELKE